jgi:lipoprotein-releasing system permease protein
LPYEVLVALRYLRSRKKAGISLTSFLTVLAFTLGVAALTVVTSVWNGFEAEFLDKLLGINAHAIVLKRHDVFRNWADVAEQLKKQPGIEHVAPFVYSEVIVQSARGVQGVAIKGIDPVGAVSSPLARYVSSDEATVKATLGKLVATTSTSAAPVYPGVLIGKELQSALHVEPGESISVISPYGGKDGQARTEFFRVIGIFHSGMYEFDSRMIFVDLAEAQRFFRLYETVTGLEIWTVDPLKSQETALAAARGLDETDEFAYEVKDWSITNRGIFGTVRQQKALISIVLFIIVLVASFMIMATLILLILEKGREVAILKALGATDGSILGIFVLDGLIIGALGCGSGLVVGMAVCAVLEQYGLRLDPRVYYLEHLPIVVRPIELVVVIVGAMLLSILATLIPARKAARMRPVDGLTRRAGASTAAKVSG